MNDHNHIDFLSIFQVEQKKAINNQWKKKKQQYAEVQFSEDYFIVVYRLDFTTCSCIREEAKRMSPFLDGWDYWDTPCTCSSQVWNLQEEAKRIDALPDLDRNKRRCTIHNVVMDGEDWRRQLATFTAR